MDSSAFGPLGSLWVAFQVLLPLRHFAIPGKVNWTEEGHNFAWHMKLRDKDSSGLFAVADPASGRTWEIDSGDYLNSRQERKMTSRPQMMVQFAHYLEDRMRAEGYQDVEVRAVIFASLNGREPQQLVDPQVDLTKVSYPWFGHADWIMPLEVPGYSPSLETGCRGRQGRGVIVWANYAAFLNWNIQACHSIEFWNSRFWPHLRQIPPLSGPFEGSITQ